MVTLHEATRGDWARLFTWRNDAQTRASFLSTEPVTLEEHWAWLLKTLENDGRVLFVARDSQRGTHVGTCRVDRVEPKGKRKKDAEERPVYECSVTVDPRHRGAGYATLIIDALKGACRVLDAGEVVLRAVVRQDNLPSLRAFAAAGFEPVAFEGDTVDATVTLEATA